MRKWIADQVAALGLALGDDVSPERLLLYAEDLCDVPEERLALAFARARKEYEYPSLPPVAFIRKMAGTGAHSDGRPGPEESWARMPKGERMEENTVIWCEEERIAYGACRSLLLDGDLVGARMAFKERYEKELAAARAQRKPVRWIVSAGYDVEHRLMALVTAIQEKQIAPEAAVEFVPGERRGDFAKMLPPSEAKGLLTGRVEELSNLPGLEGVLAKMQIEGTIPEEFKPGPKAESGPCRQLAPEEIRERRQQLKDQQDFLRRSRTPRNGHNGGS
jgi:hypothetical protein